MVTIYKNLLYKIDGFLILYFLKNDTLLKPCWVYTVIKDFHLHKQIHKNRKRVIIFKGNLVHTFD